MKKIIVYLICLNFIVVSFGDIKKINAKENQTHSDKYSFNIGLVKDEALYSKYEKLVNMKKSRTITNTDDSVVLHNDLSAELKKIIMEDFKELNSIHSLDFDTEIIETASVDDVDSAIVYEKNNDAYFYVESNENPDNLLFFINNDKYILERENENYYLISENGSKLPFIETEYLDQEEVFPVTTIKSNDVMSRASWVAINTGTNYYHKTNKTWVTVLGIISAVTGSINLRIKHSVLGTISYISGVAATVGDQLYATLYVQYKQLYRSDCRSYILEYDWYYQHSNYTDFKGSASWEFHSVRPDNAGQNCRAY